MVIEREEIMERRSIQKLIFVCFSICILFIAGSVFAAPPDNFTAKMVMQGMVMPMAKMGNKTRMENPMMEGMVTISLMDSRKTIMMSTVNKTYMEQGYKEDTPSVYDPRVVFEKKKIGSETIDGHPCIKYDTTFYLKDKPAEKYRAIIWEAQDLGGLPIRNEMIIPPDKRHGGLDKMVTEIKEIKVGAARASMFEVPANFKKVNTMQEVMGMGGMLKQMERMKRKGPKE
ncbi:MAG: hypothetical protein FJ241_00965 [Nitrospira sp.]|nr:hypothetical protein [Nitrospira sp.]